MLDIDLISEPPHAPSPQMYVYKVWESVWPEGQEAGVSGCHIFVPAPHAPPPKGIGQRSKVIILPTTAQHALTVTQAAATQTAAVMTVIRYSKDDSNNMTIHNSRNASNSRTANTVGTPTTEGMLA
jgi:hypothetical protein